MRDPRVLSIRIRSKLVRDLLNLTEVPKSMTIIGGGSIGCEMAQAFTRLGTKCAIVQMDNSEKNQTA